MSQSAAPQHNPSSASPSTSLHLVTQFAQVGFPPDAANLARFRVPPRWSPDEMRIRTLQHQQQQQQQTQTFSQVQTQIHSPASTAFLTGPGGNDPVPGSPFQHQGDGSVGGSRNTLGLMASHSSAHLRHSTGSTMADTVRQRSSSSTNAGGGPTVMDVVMRDRKLTAVDPCTIRLPDSPPASPFVTLHEPPSESIVTVTPAPFPPWTEPTATSHTSLTGRSSGGETTPYLTTTRELSPGQLTPTPARLLSISDARASSQFALHQRRVTAGTMSSTMSRSIATGTNNFVKEKPPHPVEYRYKAQIIDSYPRVKKDAGKAKDEWLNHLPLFVFPDHMSIKECPTSPPPTTCHSFVLTKEDGTKLHGTSLTFWEKPAGQLGATLKYQSRAWYVRNINESDLEYLTHLKSQIHALKSQLARDDMLDRDERLVVEDRLKLFTDLMKPYVTNACVDTDALWVPRALVLLSPWPVYDLMEDWLKCTFRGVMDANGTTLSLEACLVNVVHEVPMPPPGRREIAIRAHSSDLYFARPAPNEITALKNVSFYPLFRTLPVESIVFLLECLLNEKRVLLVSEFPGLLNNSVQSLLLLMFPFNWFHVLISILPIDLIGYLEAPVPFLIGLIASHLALVNPEILADDLVVVNLDTGTLTNALRTPPTPLPARRRSKFLGRLRASCMLDPGIGAGPPLAITEAFPLGKLQTRTGTSLLSTPLSMRDRLGASDPDLFAHHQNLVNAFGGPPSQGSSTLRSPDSVSSSEISIQPIPPPVQIYPAGQSPVSRATPSVISVATTTSLASRFSLFRRGSNASATASSVGSGNTVLPSPAGASQGRNEGPGQAGSSGGGFLHPSQTHKVVIEGHSFSADNGPLSLPRSPNATGSHPSHMHPPSTAGNPARRWPTTTSSMRCAECDTPDTPAKPLSRCWHCGLTIHMDCARTSLVAWCPRALDEPRIRRAALKLWVSIMRGYRGYLTRSTGGGDFAPGLGGPGIHLVKWINEGTDADARGFMKMFVETQAFSMFVQDRTGGVDGGGGGGGSTADAEIIFFDEAIKAKRGRLARTVVRSSSDNAFFKDMSFSVASVYRCPSPHQGDRVQVHKSFPLTSDATFAATPIRRCDSLITPQEELMLTLYTAKMIRQAKRYAAAAAANVSVPSTPIAGANGVGRPNTASTTSTSNSPTTPIGEWWRRINAVTSATAVLPSPMSADIVDQHNESQAVTNDAEMGGPGGSSPLGMLDVLVPRGAALGMESPDQSRARVDEFLNRAWDTLKDPVFGQPLRSRDDYALRHAKLSEIGHGLNTLLLTCQQADLDDIILITSQIDRMVACLEDEFRDLFVDEGMLNRLLAGKAAGEGAPKLEWTSPSVDLSDLDVLKCVSASAMSGLNGGAGEHGIGGTRGAGV